MAIRKCIECGTRNGEPGDCVVCGRSLGSPVTAVNAAAGTAVLLSLLWLVFTWLTGIAFPVFALVYGWTVSFVAVRVSWGRGLLYQAIVSGVSLLGIVVTDALLVQWFWHEWYPNWPPEEPPPELRELIPTLLQWDPWHVLFALFGVLGTLWVWRKGDPED